jgi:hypothetical protein
MPLRKYNKNLAGQAGRAASRRQLQRPRREESCSRPEKQADYTQDTRDKNRTRQLREHLDLGEKSYRTMMILVVRILVDQLMQWQADRHEGDADNQPKQQRNHYSSGHGHRQRSDAFVESHGSLI